MADWPTPAPLGGQAPGSAGEERPAESAAPALDRQAVDSACGKARRHSSFCPENLGYPRRILTLLQPRYLAWGRGVSA